MLYFGLYYGPCGSLTSVEELRDNISTRIDDDDKVNFYGGRWFVAESMSLATAIFIAKTLQMDLHSFDNGKTQPLLT